MSHFEALTARSDAFPQWFPCVLWQAFEVLTKALSGSANVFEIHGNQGCLGIYEIDCPTDAFSLPLRVDHWLNTGVSFLHRKKHIYI